MNIVAAMSEQPDLGVSIHDALQGIDDLSPAEELARYETVLTQLTSWLNAPEDTTPEAH